MPQRSRNIKTTEGSSYFSTLVQKSENSTDNAIIRFDDSEEGSVKKSGVIINDTNDITDINSLTCSSATLGSGGTLTLLGGPPTAFTPTLTDDLGNHVGYSLQNGTYQIVGPLCYFQSTTVWTNKTSVTGITNVRFSVPVISAVTPTYLAITIGCTRGFNPGVTKFITCVIQGSADYGWFLMNDLVGSGGDIMLWNDMDTTGAFNVSGIYFV